MRVKLVFALLMVLSIAAFVQAEDFDSEVELILNPNTKTSFLKADAALPVGSQSLWDENDLSSSWLLSIDGIDHTPAEAGWVRSERRIEGGHRLRYSNQTFIMDQELFFSAGRRHALLLFRFTNKSGRTVDIEPSLLLDTSLGETTGVPFKLSDASLVVGETEKVGDQVPEWIKSERDSLSPPLIISFDGTTANRPRRIVMANWLRLKESGPDLAVQEGRSFDYLPFSENDSAVLLQYDERQIAPDSSMEWTLVFGLEEHRAGSDVFDVVFDPDVARVLEYTIRERLRAVDADIDAIDALLNNQSRINEDTVADAEIKVNEQEKLRAEYENL